MAVAKVESRGPIFSYTTSNESLTAGTAEVVMYVKTGGSNTARILYWSVSFDGTSASAEPVDVQLCRFTFDGTTSTSGYAKIDPASASATAAGWRTFTGIMPTVGDILWEGMVHPQGGRLEMSYASDLWQAPNLAVSTRMGIRCTAAETVNCTATMVWEEF